MQELRIQGYPLAAYYVARLLLFCTTASTLFVKHGCIIEVLYRQLPDSGTTMDCRMAGLSQRDLSGR